MTDAPVLRISIATKQQHPKHSYYGHLPLAGTSPVASQPPLGAFALGNAYIHFLAVVHVLAR